MLTVHPCVHACLPLPAGNPSDRKVACGSGDVDAPTQGVPVPGRLSGRPRGGLAALGGTHRAHGLGEAAQQGHVTGPVSSGQKGVWAAGHVGVRAAVAPLGPPLTSGAPRLQTQLIQMVVWMLQRRLLVQLHTYVCLMASPSEDEPRAREDDAPLATRVGGRSLSTPNALSFGSPSRASCPWASVWWGVSTWAPLGEAGGWEVRLGHLQVSRAPSQGRTRAPAHTRPTGQLCLGDGRSSPASLRTGLCLAESEQPGPVWGWSRPHRIPGGPLKPAAPGPLEMVTGPFSTEPFGHSVPLRQQP